MNEQLLSRLERLAKLKEQGVITHTEFEQQKAALLKNTNLSSTHKAARPTYLGNKSGIGCGTWLLVLIVVVALTVIIGQFDNTSGSSSDVSNVTSNIATPEEPKLPAPRMPLMSDVHLVLARLSLLDIGTFGNWRKDDFGYIASTHYYSFGEESVVNGMQNNLAMYAKSDNGAYIQTIKLMINVNNGAQKKQALKKYAVTGKGMFDKLRMPMPAGLQKAMINGKAFYSDDEFGTVINEVNSARIDWYTLIITPK